MKELLAFVSKIFAVYNEAKAAEKVSNQILKDRIEGKNAKPTIRFYAYILRDLPDAVDTRIRKLKHTVNKVSSLRDLIETGICFLLICNPCGIFYESNHFQFSIFNFQFVQVPAGLVVRG
jgi:hypothetical protein